MQEEAVAATQAADAAKTARPYLTGVSEIGQQRELLAKALGRDPQEFTYAGSLERPGHSPESRSLYKMSHFFEAEGIRFATLVGMHWVYNEWEYTVTPAQLEIDGCTLAGL